MEPYHLEYSERCADGVVEIVNGNKSVEEVRRELERWLESINIAVPRTEGSLEVGAMRRSHMELRNPVDAIRYCSHWISGRSYGASWAFPFREIHFYRGEEQYGVMVRERWASYAGILNHFLPRMIAPKDHPIWSDFGDFNLPWGPFFKEELSGGGLGIIMRGVKRCELINLGLWKRGDAVVPLPPDVDPKFGSSKILASEWRKNPGLKISNSFPAIMVPYEFW
jgi:hypothetical protein